MLHPAKLIGTWFGVGLAPKAAGTFGSIAALPFAWVIQSTYGKHGLITRQHRGVLYRVAVLPFLLPLYQF